MGYGLDKQMCKIESVKITSMENLLQTSRRSAKSKYIRDVENVV